jgi:hypothetical protein
VFANCKLELPVFLCHLSLLMCLDSQSLECDLGEGEFTFCL